MKPSYNSWLISTIRNYMRDFAKRNKLILREEHTDGEIQDAMDTVVEHFNSIPPMLSVVVNLKTYPSMNLFKWGCAVELLYSESILRARNELSYNDGSITINDDDKLRLYLQLIDRLELKYTKGVEERKMSMNIECAYGSLASPYSLYSIYTNI